MKFTLLRLMVLVTAVSCKPKAETSDQSSSELSSEVEVPASEIEVPAIEAEDDESELVIDPSAEIMQPTETEGEGFSLSGHVTFQFRNQSDTDIWIAIGGSNRIKDSVRMRHVGWHTAKRGATITVQHPNADSWGTWFYIYAQSPDGKRQWGGKTKSLCVNPKAAFSYEATFENNMPCPVGSFRRPAFETPMLRGSSSYTWTFGSMSQYLNELQVTKLGIGTGKVVSNPKGIDCGSTCKYNLNQGTVVLTATPDAGSLFAGWTGCPQASGSKCTVAVAAKVEARFDSSRKLTVTKVGTGTGLVTGTGINCGKDCTETYPTSKAVTMTAVAATGAKFAGWTGCPTPKDNTCTITLNGPLTLKATFTK